MLFNVVSASLFLGGVTLMYALRTHVVDLQWYWALFPRRPSWSVVSNIAQLTLTNFPAQHQVVNLMLSQSVVHFLHRLLRVC